MPERKRSTRSGKASSGTSNNHFTTERSVGGERRSIRHYHDGRVSQRETPVPGPVQKLIQSKLTTRIDSTSASTVFNAKAVCKPKEPEYQPPTPAEIERLAGAVTNLFHPERTKPFDKPPLQIESPQSWSSDGSYGMITPPFPVASPTPEDSPELMSTEVFPLPVTVNPDTSDEDSNTISKQWGQMGGKNRGHSDIYN
ncbi:hypothetical protein Pdw03_1560 [Penicillium digitatum]|jgi:hypothetical protein|uniref:Uncharacterized protein n=3 Tax=Penicillium digitatum TaxID=36651 RepID=K9FSU7_PEND2|nr:hypothetical protein PDIP_06500 [Penicillium digitatum Pd1]EKV12720.1 hypothetical protein PDIG_41560 [Penicillium digitatum PHI26]EKV21441.1 hypothetical protein PDIP_06500 [Penicillium digitatum Pd1]QQK46662.1 hypothetical protein Pdw03_1560 [Penicillium digitatum]